MLSPAFRTGQATQKQTSRDTGYRNIYRNPSPRTEALLPTENNFVSDTLPERTFPSSRKLTGLFVSGLFLALSTRWLFRGLLSSKKPLLQTVSSFSKIPQEPLKKPLMTALGKTEQSVSSVNLKDALKQDELNIWLLFQDQLTSLYRLALHEPEQRKTLAAYAGAGILGYLSGSLFQGIQESWVRREETLIRSQLLSKMANTIRNSIRIKHAQDRQLHEEVKNRLREILLQYRVSTKQITMVNSPVVESPLMTQQYFYQPTHLTLPQNPFLKGSALKFEGSEASPSNPMEYSRWRHRLWEAVALGSGFALGTFCLQFLNLLAKAGQVFQQEAKASTLTKKIVETINVPNHEALFVLGFNRNKLLLLSIIGITAAAKLGKLWIDGLREIEVTRANATTELRYQNHNWLSLDPKLHDIAEREAIEQELRQFTEDVPALMKNISLLEQRVQTLLANIGRHSAPKYFSMIPMVGLREARS